MRKEFLPGSPPNPQRPTDCRRWQPLRQRAMGRSMNFLVQTVGCMAVKVPRTEIGVNSPLSGLPPERRLPEGM